jgi:hypothetical protein
VNYSQEDFIKLIEEVEFQGGTHLDEDCEPVVVALKKEHPRGKASRFKLARCGNPALFDIPYGLENPGPAGEMGIIKVCAVDDSIGLWPRFKHALEEQDD